MYKIFTYYYACSCSVPSVTLLLSGVGEEHSRVQAHMDGDEFSAHILTDEAEYNVEVRTVLTLVCCVAL